MPNHTDNTTVKIEAGQILEPGFFPLPKELVCIHVLKVIDQVAIRDCLIRDVILTPQPGVCRSEFIFEKADDFTIKEVKVLSSTESWTKPGYKKLKLCVKIRYNIFYSDGAKHLKQPDEAAFNLTVNDIYCPDCSIKTGVTCYPHGCSLASNEALDNGDLSIKVEALAGVINEMICSCTGALILQIGAFFVVKCGFNVDLVVPSYGYCPMPSEQKKQ